MITPFLLNGFKKSVKNAGGVLYLDTRKATGFGIPSNSPLTSPFVDLNGYENNATLNNFAGNVTSGYDTTEILKPSLVFDGVDDFLSLVNVASLKLISPPLGIFFTVKLQTNGSGTTYLFCKNFDSTTNIQLSIGYHNADNRITIRLEGQDRISSAINSIMPNTWYNIGFIWDGNRINVYINCNFIGYGTYSGNLTEQPNILIGKRLITSGITKGAFATATIYQGSKSIESNILKAEKLISKAYID